MEKRMEVTKKGKKVENHLIMVIVNRQRTEGNEKEGKSEDNQ